MQDLAEYPVPPFRGEPAQPVASLPPGVPLPAVDVAVQSPAGAVWIGGKEGVARYDAGQWRCFWGKRWLPHNHALDIRFGSLDTYVRTKGGWSQIRHRTMTLEEKADHYQRLTEERHIRGGYVARCLVAPAHRYRAVDNDGLWTALYCAAQSFRFAATGDREAKRLADRSLDALLELEQVTGVPGFPARSLVRPEERRVALADGKWHDSPTQPGTRWKGDTSSDELSGHFFAYHVYSRFAADEVRRRGIAEAAGRILNRLLENGLRIVDGQGRPTRWGDFSPDSLNHDPSWDHERGLNSLSILSFLAVGHQLTGHDRYQEVFRVLVDQHGYLQNTLDQKMLHPKEVNHSDDQLAFLAFYCLLHTLPGGADRDTCSISLQRSFEIERNERCPLYNLVALTQAEDDAARRDSVQTLEEWPWDLRDWACRNAHRRDLEYDGMADRFGRTQTLSVLSPSERPVYRWNTNPYVADGGGDGSLEEDGSAWLLAYWLGRCHGLIGTGAGT